MFERRRAPEDPVVVHLDGKAITAERGEPLAVAILAAGDARIARSPKLHRPRGPSCLRGDCDGCLARVSDRPNTMTCLVHAEGGEHVATQNVLGSKDTDLLRVTDWFFPKGIDHHHLLAGIPGVSDFMQAFARRMAGIGRLPTEIEAPKPARRIVTDALIVGGGVAGVAIANELARRGFAVHVVDDGRSIGGSARALGAEVKCELDARVDAHFATSAVGVYEREILAASPSGAILFEARARVFATGAHDGALAVPNNDLPGVMSARALSMLLAYGLVPTERVALVGSDYWAERLATRLGDKLAVRLAEGEVASIRGGSRVKGITDAGGKTTKAGIVAVGVAGAPSFELAQAAGANVELRAGGFAVVTDANGRAADGVWAAGECTGLPFDPGGLERQARAVAADIAAALAAP